MFTVENRLFKNAENSKLRMEVSSLSGGEKHQLAMAMVMMKKPKLLILDRPLAGLSLGNVKRLFEILEKIKDEEQMSILLVEQNIKLADRFSNMISLLQEGKLQAIDVSFEQIEKKYFDN